MTPVRARPAAAALGHVPGDYPLDLALSVGDLGSSPRLELCRQGLDEDVVMLKAVSG